MADKSTQMEPAPKLSAEELARAKEENRQAKERKAAETAPTTKTGMGKLFKKGGFVRSADGCAQRGKTKGRMV